MRVEIRVADGHVKQLHAQLLVQATDQLERLGQVDLGAALRAHAPAVRMDKAVVYVQAGGDNEVLTRGVHRIFDAVAQQAGAVFQAAAERALAGVGGEQLAVQVAVAALDVHAVKACALGQLCRLAELFLERHQIVVRQDAVGRDRVVALKNRVVVRDQRRRRAVRLGIAAGMRRLHNDHRLEAVFLHAGLLDIRHEFLERRKVFLMQPELARVGTALLHDRDRLCPDQPGAAPGETVVPPQGQRVRTAVRRAVAALHRLDSDRVGTDFAADLHFPVQHVHVFAQRQRHIQLVELCLQLIQLFVMKLFMFQNAQPPSFCISLIICAVFSPRSIVRTP